MASEEQPVDERGAAEHGITTDEDAAKVLMGIRHTAEAALTEDEHEGLGKVEAYLVEDAR